MNTFALSLLVVLVVLGLSTACTVQPKSLNKQMSLRQAEFSSFEDLNNRNRARRARRRRRRNRRRNIAQCRALRFRTLDGTCNNLRRINQGSTDTPFLLVAPRVDIDITTVPNARRVSNIVCTQGRVTPNSRRMSELVTYFGQFIDHTVTETGTEADRPWDITVPRNDPVFDAGDTLAFRRTELAGRGALRAPENLLSSYLDGASIYSADEDIARELRTGTDGLLLVGPGNLLPKNEEGFFRAGDARANENPLLTAIHTLFVREHNRVAAEVKTAFPRANDERLYQITRKVIIGLFQSVVYDEFIPAVAGRGVGPYRGYRPNVRAAVSNTFSTVAFRVGHTMINPVITSIRPNGRSRTIPLRRAFFRPRIFERQGVDNLFRGMLATRTSEIDNEITDEVRNFLIADMEQRRRIRLDLAALNIQRGRDHGVPDYNSVRAAFGLPRFTRINQITANTAVRNKLRRAYNNDINKIDAWVGGISETQRIGSLGQLFGTVWLQEFRRLRDGDRFFFEAPNVFTAREIRLIPTLNALVGSGTLRGNVMQSLLQQNTGLTNVPANPFFTA